MWSAIMTHFPSDVTSFQDNAAEDEHGFGCMPFAMLLFSWDTRHVIHAQFKLYEIQIHSQKEGQDPKAMPLCHHLI